MRPSSIHFHLFSLREQYGVICSSDPCAGPSSRPAWDPRSQAVLPLSLTLSGQDSPKAPRREWLGLGVYHLGVGLNRGDLKRKLV